MTVRENLALHARKAEEARALEQATEVFPVLGIKLRRPVGQLSGGQQQMLSLVRAYITDSRLVLVDEASMGLAKRPRSGTALPGLSWPCAVSPAREQA